MAGSNGAKRGGSNGGGGSGAGVTAARQESKREVVTKETPKTEEKLVKDMTSAEVVHASEYKLTNQFTARVGDTFAMIGAYDGHGTVGNIQVKVEKYGVVTVTPVNSSGRTIIRQLNYDHGKRDSIREYVGDIRDIAKLKEQSPSTAYFRRYAS